jgi:hypothetical protein
MLTGVKPFPFNYTGTPVSQMLLPLKRFRRNAAETRMWIVRLYGFCPCKCDHVPDPSTFPCVGWATRAKVDFLLLFRLLDYVESMDYGCITLYMCTYIYICVWIYYASSRCIPCTSLCCLPIQSHTQTCRYLTWLPNCLVSVHLCGVQCYVWSMGDIGVGLGCEEPYVYCACPIRMHR